MWDADPIGEWYNSGKRIVYPITVIAHYSGSAKLDLLIVSAQHVGNWISLGYYPQLRYPTPEELATLKWPTEYKHYKLRTSEKPST